MRDYIETLNLPKTKFPMKANLKETELEILKKWEDFDIYSLLRKKLKGRKKFILHDGPPYANGNIHLGTALNKILKDIVIKYKTMKGFDCPFIPGWDCHGLPVEYQLFKELGKTKFDISQIDFRKSAFDYALKFVEIQKSEFKRLGVFGDWKSPYLTLSPEYEYRILLCLLKLVKEGFIYRALLPVNWCIECETALAEAEVEYEEKVSPSVYVKFKVKKDLGFKKDLYLVIWTTTPWTLCSNTAVAANSNFDYSFLETKDSIYLIAEDTRERVFRDIGLSHLCPKEQSEDYRILKKIKGKEIENLEYEHPFLEDQIIRRVVLSDFVKKEEGTGLVHIAPGHGQQDYFIGLKYKLPIIMPVDEKGRFDEKVRIDQLIGEEVGEANYKIIQILKEKKSLLYESKISHSYPHCWRCKKPLIFRATEQWFLDIDKKNLRKNLLRVIKKIRWIPEEGKNRISAMLNIRPHWCLSRQRYWGVPIPAVECQNCKRVFLEPKVIKKFLTFVKKEGTDCWFKRSIFHFLPKDFRCPNCSKKGFKKTQDILDVWFDSGVSFFSVLKKRKILSFPSDLYLEGSDQHRGWFQVSLICSFALEKKPPFKSCLTHGFVVDGEGRKMSKSLGNVISPHQIISEYGADILRLWVAASDYTEDIRISKEIIDRVIEAYRKIRNTIRFLISNLYDFSPKKDALKYKELEEIDRFSLHKLQELIKDVNLNYENFKFYNSYKKIYSFCSEFLSSFYLDILKDRLYTYSKDSKERRSAQTVLYQILNILTRLISPILAFTAEEIYSYFPVKENLSIHLESFPKIKNIWKDLELNKRWERILNLRGEVLKEIEAERIKGNIGSSLECQVNLSTNDKEEYDFLKNYLRDLPSVFIVSGVKLNFVTGENFKRILISRADGEKCIRCWNYSVSVGKDRKHLSLCERCLKVVSQYE